MEGMLKRIMNKTSMIAAGGLFLLLCCSSVHGFVCSGSMYNSPAFQERVTSFSPFEKVYLIIECSGLKPGEHTMHANWIHQQRGVIRSDKHSFTAEEDKKQGIFFWFKLSKKGPMASMFSGQDFHEDNFGDWTVESYLDDQLILKQPFTITDEVPE